jgi:hypothetical protein
MELEKLPISTVTFALAARVNGDTLFWLEKLGKRPGREIYECLDIVVDGISLHQKINGTKNNYDMNSHIGWDSYPDRNKLIDELLLKLPASLPGNRRPLFGCHACDDLWCGNISIFIEQKDSWTFWRDFALQTPYIKSPDLEEFRDLGPFKFDTATYVETILNAPTVESLMLSDEEK